MEIECFLSVEDTQSSHTSIKSGWEYIDCLDIALLRRDSKRICDFELHGLILDCWTDIHEWMAVLVRGLSKDVVFWDLVHLSSSTASDISEAACALYERDGVDSRCLCSWTSRVSPKPPAMRFLTRDSATQTRD